MTPKDTPTSAVIDTDTEADEPPEDQQQWDEFWRTVDRIRERNADKDPDEEFAFITQVVEEVRQERYEREQHQAKNGC